MSATAALHPTDDDSSFLSRSLKRGIGSCGTALHAVAKFLNECVLSGIPFHVAERAMRESRLSYRKFWDQAFVDDDGASPRGSTQEPCPKRRRLQESHEMEVEWKRQHSTDIDNNEWIHLARSLEADGTLGPPIGNPDLVNSEDEMQEESGNDTFAPYSSMDSTLKEVQDMLEEKQREEDENEIHFFIQHPRQFVARTVRSGLIDSLVASQGDTSNPGFLASLDVLSSFYRSSGHNACSESDEVSSILNGSWVNITRPSYKECLGTNARGDFEYTLGRMSFDMFQPTSTRCSVQSTHNTIKVVSGGKDIPSSVPYSLRDEVKASSPDTEGDQPRTALRTYDIAVSLTIEPNKNGEIQNDSPAPPVRLRALMCARAYMLPDPKQRNRFTIWFTSGELSPAVLSSSRESDANDEGYGDFEDWEAFFGKKKKWSKTFGERAKIVAARFFLGADIPDKMNDDGSLAYSLNRPIGGHEKTYIDVLYLDEDLLITKGHFGTVFVMAKSGIAHRYNHLRNTRSPSPVWLER